MTIRSKPPSKEYDKEFDRIFKKKAVVAQPVEHLPCKQGVEGAEPSDSTTDNKRKGRVL